MRRMMGRNTCSSHAAPISAFAPVFSSSSVSIMAVARGTQEEQGSGLITSASHVSPPSTTLRITGTPISLKQVWRTLDSVTLAGQAVVSFTLGSALSLARLDFQ